MTHTLEDLVLIAVRIRDERYPNSKAFFLAGSHVRGDATASSDLDIVVVLDHVPCAYRQSFYFENWPVEVFVHDRQTLSYFFKTFDRGTGVPSLATMVAEGIDIPAGSEFSRTMKHIAHATLSGGPPTWSDEDREDSRYRITNLIDDLKHPRSDDEAVAVLISLYPALAEHYFRTRGLWSASGKTIARALTAHDPDLARRFLDGFEQAFAGMETDGVIKIATEIVGRDGGLLFEGYCREAPGSWRDEA